MVFLSNGVKLIPTAQRYKPMSSQNIKDLIPQTRQLSEPGNAERLLKENYVSADDGQKPLSDKMIQALANPLFPSLDSQLRSGRHIGLDDLDNHIFLMDFQSELEQFYHRYNVELIRAPEGFFYLRPRSTTLIPRSVLSELDMLVGKVLCYLYLSPERLAHEGIFNLQELYDELITLSEESKLLKLVNQRSSGSDLDRQKLYEKVKTSLNRLRRLGMIYFVQNDTYKFRINEAIFRFGADVKSSDDIQEAQRKLIQEGEAVMLKNTESLAETKVLEDVSEDTEEEQ